MTDRGKTGERKAEKAKGADKAEEKLTRDGFPRNLRANGSFLSFHKGKNGVSDTVEIGMPYMIIYEAANLQQGKLRSLEFTESNKAHAFFNVSDLDREEKRTLHSHDCYEMTVVLSGEVQLQIENETVTYRAGEGCLCNRNIRHKELHNSNFEIVLFLFQEAYIKSVLEQDILYDEEGKGSTVHTFFHHLFAENSKLPFYSAREYIDFRNRGSLEPETLYGLLNRMLPELCESHPGRTYMMRGYLCRLVAFFGDEKHYRIRTHQTRISKEEQLFYRVLNQLQSRKGRISRRQLEAEVNYNSDYINRVMKKYSGRTLSEYSRELLLEEAARQLKNTDKKVGTICEEAGYSNRSHFNRLFTNRYGMSPARYREVNK